MPCRKNIKVLGDKTVTGVVLKDNTQLECEMIVCGIGLIFVLCINGQSDIPVADRIFKASMQTMIISLFLAGAILSLALVGAALFAIFRGLMKE